MSVYVSNDDKNTSKSSWVEGFITEGEGADSVHEELEGEQVLYRKYQSKMRLITV
jgi:hypothetical protein